MTTSTSEKRKLRGLTARVSIAPAGMGIALLAIVAASIGLLTSPAGAQTYYPAPPVSCFAAGHGSPVTCTIHSATDPNSEVTITVGGTAYHFGGQNGPANYGPMTNGPHPTADAQVSFTINGITYTSSVTIVRSVGTPTPTATPAPYVTPVPTTVPTVAPTATAVPKKQPPLAVTGANSAFATVMGATLLVLGSLFVLTTRRLGGLRVETGTTSSRSAGDRPTSFAKAIED